MQYRPDIDGLRSVAVIPVLLFHAGFSLFGGGYAGVDIFFVISGFLITSIIIRELDQGRFSLVTFYERRARRILPALFFVLAACLPLAWMLLLPVDMRDFAQSLAAVALFSSNILFWKESGYFEAAAELKPLLHTWSLAVEEQYYILFPLLLMATWRWGRRISLFCLIAIFAVSLALAQMLVIDHPSTAFYLLPTRAWELMAGAFAAFYLGRAGAVPPSLILAQIGSAVGLTLIVVSIFVFDAGTPFSSLYTLVPVAGAVLVILSNHPGTAVATLLSSRGFVGIGLISYSTYLWHQPLFAFTRYSRPEHPSALVMLGLIALSLALGYVSWRWVERPFRTKGRIGRGTIFAFSGTGMAALIALGAVTHLFGGLPDRFTPSQIALFESAAASPMRSQCHDLSSPDDACAYFVDAPTWAVLGDSHAVELSYALATRLRDRDDGLLHLSSSGCAPRFGTPGDADCTPWTRAAMDRLLTSEEITTVVVTYRMGLHLFGDHEGIYPGSPDDVPPETQAQLWTAYVETLRALIDGGKTVHLILQAPEVPDHVNRYLRTAAPEDPSASGPSLPGMPRAWWEKRMAYVTDRLDQIPEGVHVHDPADTFCDATTCFLTAAGKSLYYDDDHMSVVGAGLIADRILAGKRSAHITRP